MSFWHLSLKARAEHLASFFRTFQQSQAFEKALNYYEKSIFLERCDEVLDLPFRSLTQKEALLAYAQQDLSLDKPRRVLILLGGNLPAPFLFFLAQGLTAGVRFTVKPSSKDPLFPHLLAESLASYFHRRDLLHIVKERGEELLHKPILEDAVIIFGAERACALWEEKAKREKKPILAFGERISGGIVSDSPAPPTSLLASDIALFDQQGCFAPHFFLYEGRDPYPFAVRLLSKLRSFKPPPRSPSVQAQIHYTLHAYRVLKAVAPLPGLRLLAAEEARIILLPPPLPGAPPILPRFIGARTLYLLPHWSKEALEKALPHPIATLVASPPTAASRFPLPSLRTVPPGDAQANSVAEPHEKVRWVKALFGKPPAPRMNR